MHPRAGPGGVGHAALIGSSIVFSATGASSGVYRVPLAGGPHELELGRPFDRRARKERPIGDESQSLAVCQLCGGRIREWLGRGDALYVRLADGERARLTRAAQLSLADRLVDLGAGRFALRLGGADYPVGADGGPEPVRSPG